MDRWKDVSIYRWMDEASHRIFAHLKEIDPSMFVSQYLFEFKMCSLYSSVCMFVLVKSV